MARLLSGKITFRLFVDQPKKSPESFYILVVIKKFQIKNSAATISPSFPLQTSISSSPAYGNSESFENSYQAKALALPHFLAPMVWQKTSLKGNGGFRRRSIIAPAIADCAHYHQEQSKHRIPDLYMNFIASIFIIFLSTKSLLALFAQFVFSQLSDIVGVCRTLPLP